MVDLYLVTVYWKIKPENFGSSVVSAQTPSDADLAVREHFAGLLTKERKTYIDASEIGVTACEPLDDGAIRTALIVAKNRGIL